MSTTLYSASVPVFIHYLRQLRATLDVAENHARRTGRPLLGAALAEGMFAFAQQVTIACGFCVRACCPLLGIDAPVLAGGDQDWDQLRTRIDATLAFLNQVPAATIDAAEDMEVVTTAGLVSPVFDGRDFVLSYALPNFFFHLVTAHAVLRSQGVPVGKEDFDGYHQYQAGFSFTQSK
ncbi:MAG: DUF1993 domain-containing protein [Pseudomonadota bacterium]